MSGDPLEPGARPAAISGDPLEAGEAGDKVIRGSGLRVAAHAIGIGAGVISAPLVVRHLGVGDYGRYALVLSIVFIATALTEGGLAAVAVRRYAVSDPQERRRLIAALLGLRIVLSLIGAVVAVAFGLIAGYDEIVVVGIALGGLALLVNNLWGAFQVALVAQLRLGSVAALEIVRSLATVIALVALVAAGAGLGLFYVVAPAVAVLAFAVAARLVGRSVPRLPAFDGERWRALLRETALYAAAVALGAMYFQVAMVATSLLTDDHETGIFGISFRIVDLANGIPWLLAGSVFPILAHAAANDLERLRYAVGRVTEVGLIAGGSFAVVFVLGAEFAIEVVAGDQADQAIGVLRILALGVMATFLVASWGFVLLSRQRYRALVTANATAFALSVALSLVLIPAFGADGAGAVTATLEITLAVMYGVILWRELPGLAAGAALAPRLAAALAAAFAAGVPLLAVHAVPATVAGVTVYVAVLWWLRAIPPELLSALRLRAAS